MVAYQNALNRLLEIDSDQALFADMQVQQLLTYIDTSKKKLRILDVGCGEGFITHLLSKALPQAEIIGLDQSAEKIAFARELTLDQRFFVGTLENEALEEIECDYIYTSLVLHHVADSKQQEFVKAMHNLLRQGGIGIVLELNPLNISTRKEFYRNPEEAGLKLLWPWNIKKIITTFGKPKLSFYDFPKWVTALFRPLCRFVPLGKLYALVWVKQ